MLGNGCQVEVSYRTRIACGQFDYSLDSIRPLTPGCIGRSLTWLWDTSATILVRKNPRPFAAPGPDSCIIYRVFKPACAKASYYHAVGGDTVYASCDTSACCVGYFQVCNVPADSMKVSGIYWKQYGVCDPEDSVCQDICAQSPSIPFKQPHHTESHQSISATLYPNPSSGQITVSIANGILDECTVDIIDVTGRLICEVAMEYGEDGKVDALVATHSWRMGVYFVRIKHSRGTHMLSFIVQ